MTETESIFAEERKDRILAILERKQKVTVSELSKAFLVSEVTIRKDLNSLEGIGLLKRTHGGAISVRSTQFELPTVEKVVKNKEGKERIGAYAASLIQDGESVLLDSGTTTLEIARNLRNARNLTVVVNDLNLAAALQPYPGIELIVLGGALRKGVTSLVGPITLNALSSLYVDRLFLAADGISLERGITTPDMIHAETKRKMTEVAREVIVVADDSKIGRTSFTSVVPLDKVDLIITDKAAPMEQLMEIEESQVQIVTV